MQGQDVFIVGAGNSAGQAALHLAKHAREVTLVVRGESLSKSMSSYLIGPIESAANIAVRYRTEVIDGAGDEQLRTITVADRAHGTIEEVPAAALFIMIGAIRTRNGSAINSPGIRGLPDHRPRRARSARREAG